MRRSGICGRCSFQGGRSQAAWYGARSCAATTMGGGSTGNTSKASTAPIAPRGHCLHPAGAHESPYNEGRHICPLAGVAVLVALSADVGKMHIGSPGIDCDGGSRCAVTAIVSPPVAAHQGRRSDANGNAAGFVISSRTGARARVGIRYVARFQAYIDDLENNHGARVLFMGGIRPGGCSPSSEHPCGKALDVCQLRRGVVDSRCKLPGRAALAQIAASHGLFEGGRWCNSDYGHAQVGVTPSCGESRSRIARKNKTAPEAWAQNVTGLTASY